MTAHQKYSIKELHKQFSPNIWNPKKDKIDIVMDHFRISTDGTNQARQELSCSLDNSYGEKLAEKFDVYGTDLPSTCKIFIFVHGGGWQMGSKDLSGFFAPVLYKLGLRTVTLGYTLGPEGSVTNMIEQLKTGINTIMKLYPDSEEFIISGHSAGAHLVSSLLHEEYLICTKLKKVVLFSGVYDLRGFFLTVFNKKAGITEEESVKLSSNLRTYINSSVKSQQARVLIIVGKYEPPIFIEQATEYYQHLKSLGVQCEFMLSQEDDHFSIVENLREAASPISRRLEKFLDLPTLTSRL